MISKFPLNIVGGTVFSRYPKLQGGKTYNMIVTGDQVKGLVNFAGYNVVIDFLTGAARGVFLSTVLNEIVIVFGSSVYLINANLGYRFIGELDSSTGNVYITENANSQIGLVDGDRLYVYNYSNSSFTQPDIYFRPQYIDFLDTYGIASFDNGGWGICHSGNLLLWDADQQQQMQSKADKLQVAVVLNRQLWILGNKCGEVWADLGADPFPFVRDNSLSTDYGAANIATVDKGFGLLVWLAKNEKSGFSVVATNGGVPFPISDEGLDYVINALSNPSNSTGGLFKLDGHIFYYINFLSDNLSIIYDFNSKTWYNLTNNYLDKAHIAKKFILFNGKLHFVSNIDSKFREMSTEIEDYDGQEIPRVRITPSFRNGDDKTFIEKTCNVQMEYGHNDTVSKIQLSLSRDNGYSWGLTTTKILPEFTNRKGRTRFWTRFRSNDLTHKFQFWTKGRTVITDGYMEIIHQ